MRDKTGAEEHQETGAFLLLFSISVQNGRKKKVEGQKI